MDDLHNTLRVPTGDCKIPATRCRAQLEAPTTTGTWYGKAKERAHLHIMTLSKQAIRCIADDKCLKAARPTRPPPPSWTTATAEKTATERPAIQQLDLMGQNKLGEDKGIYYAPEDNICRPDLRHASSASTEHRDAELHASSRHR